MTRLIATSFFVTGLAISALFAAPVLAQGAAPTTAPATQATPGQGGPGGMAGDCPEMGRHHGMMGGMGMMGGIGMMGGGWDQSGDRNFSIDDVRKIIEGRLAWQGQNRLKVGDIKAKDNDTITADIVTVKENALVQRLDVNRHTGTMRPEKS